MAPYGSWSTPVTSELVVRAAAGLGGVTVHGDTVTWSEQRPEEGGRTQLVQRVGDGPAVDLLPEGFNARTAAHEYGGGAWWVAGRTVWFANWADQRLYRLTAQGDAGAGHRRARGPPGRQVGRGGPRRRRALAAGRARAPPPGRGPGGGGQRGRRRRHGGRAGPPRAGVGARLRVRPPDLPRRRPAVLAAVVAPRHAVGRDRAVRGRPAGHRRRPRAGPPARRGGPARHRSRRPRRRRVRERAPVGRGRLAVVRVRPLGLVEPVPVGAPGPRRDTRGGQRRAHGPDGCRDRRPPVGVRAVALRLPVRRAHGVRLRAGRARAAGRAPAGRHGDRPRRPVHVVRLGAGRGRPGGVHRGVGDRRARRGGGHGRRRRGGR